MKLSIIIPMYNAENYIGECLESIISQDFKSFETEIIIVNDGSVDESVQIVERYASAHTNIKIFHQKNKGQSAARNFGLTQASGDWVCFVDADDLWINDSIGKVLAKYSQWSDDQIVTFALFNGERKNYNDTKQKDGSISGPYTGIEYIAEYNYNNGPWWYIIKRNFLLENNLFFEEGVYCEDGMFTMTLLLNSSRISHTDIPVYYYVNNPSSTTTSRNQDHLNRMLNGFEYAIDYFTSLIDKHKDSMNASCLENCINRRDSYIFFYLGGVAEPHF